MVELRQRLAKARKIGLVAVERAKKLARYRGLPLTFVGNLVYKTTPYIEKVIARAKARKLRPATA